MRWLIIGRLIRGREEGEWETVDWTVQQRFMLWFYFVAVWMAGLVLRMRETKRDREVEAVTEASK